MSTVPNGKEIEAIGEAVDKMTDSDAWLLVTAEELSDGSHAFHILYRNALASHTLLKYAKSAFDEFVLGGEDE